MKSVTAVKITQKQIKSVLNHRFEREKEAREEAPLILDHCMEGTVSFMLRPDKPLMICIG